MTTETDPIAEEAARRVSALPQQVAHRMTCALRQAVTLHGVVMGALGAIDGVTGAVRGAYPESADFSAELVDAIWELDGSLILFDVLVDVRDALTAAIALADGGSTVAQVLADAWSHDELVAAVEAVYRGPLGSAAVQVVSNAPPARQPSRVLGADGGSYPASPAVAQTQRARIAEVLRDHPDWSRNKVAREVGCSPHTVASVAMEAVS